mmetsp:Transcript_14069/g.21072  ORF Transcript_14069/g.21072 Transcript_14069/m.21072 type:complete len:91 (+) Transcript_14069:30-302(+)
MHALRWNCFTISPHQCSYHSSQLTFRMVWNSCEEDLISFFILALTVVPLLIFTSPPAGVKAVPSNHISVAKKHQDDCSKKDEAHQKQERS